MFFLQMKDQRHGFRWCISYPMSQNHIGEQRIKKILSTPCCLWRYYPPRIRPVGLAWDVIITAPSQQRKKPQSGNKMWNENTSFFIKKSHKTLHKNYTNTSWKSKHSSLLVMLSCLCFPVLLQVLSACCSANCAKCDVVPASVVKK